MKQSTRFQTVNTIIAEAKSRIVLDRVGYTLNPVLSRFCLASLILMTIGIGQAWAWTGKYSVTAIAEPNTGGYVIASTSSNPTVGTATTSSTSGTCTGGAFDYHKTVTLYVKAAKKTGYTFMGWSSSKDANGGSTTNPYSSTSGDFSVLSHGDKSATYYAIFAKLAKNTASVSDFESTIGTETTQKIQIKHAHAGDISFEITGDDKANFSVKTESFTSITENNSQEIEIAFTPSKKGEHTATLTIKNTQGLTALSYPLKGYGYATSSITWVDENGAEVTSEALTLGKGEILKATCITEQTVFYSNYNNTYFEEVTYDGGPALRVKNNFTGTYTTSVTGNLAKKTDSYMAACSDNFTLNVTSLTPQSIVWEDDITDLDNSTPLPYTIPLTAVAYDNESGNPSGMSISYYVDQTDYVEIINGNTLRVKDLGGPTKITATAAGNAAYASTTVSKIITVSDVKTECSTADSDNGSTEFNKNGSYTFSVSTPGTLTFYAKRESMLLTKDLEVTEKNGNSILNTHTIAHGDIAYSGNSTKKEITLQPTTSSVVFTTKASYNYTISNVSCPRITTVTKDSTALTYATNPGVSLGKSVKITYSNVPVYLSLAKGVSSKWTISKAKFGGCGKRGTETVTLSFLANSKGEYKDTLYIKSNTGKDWGEVVLSAKVTAVEQFLDSWNIEDSYNTTDQVTLSASTTVGKTDFTFTPTESNPVGIVSITDAGVMTFSGSGTATIQAYQPGGGIYDVFTTTHNITINKVTPNIATNPTVAKIKYLDYLNNNQLSEGKATVTLHGEANTEVAGAFTWTNAGDKVTNKVGNHDYSITFTPTDGGMYNSRTFTQSVAISRADASIVMNNGSTKVKIAGINDDLNEWKIDLDTLIKSQTTDATDANRAGSVSFEVISANKTNASIDENHVFSATATGNYTVRATKAQTDWYEQATADFTITVEHLIPTLAFENTENPEVVYSNEEISQPAYRVYNGKVVDRNVQYESDDVAIYPDGTKLYVRNVTAPEGTSIPVTVTASSAADDFYNAASSSVTHNYAVRAKRSPIFYLDGNADNTTKTFEIGQTAVISYNENTDANLTVGTENEKSFISYVHNKEARTITVTALKGSFAGNGVQTITLNQPGNDRFFNRNKVYTFTVTKYQSTITLTSQNSMYVEDTIATPYSGLANEDAVSFSCSPEGSMKFENGKLIALQAGQNTVTFTQAATEYWTGISLSKTIQVNKITPTITCNLEAKYPWYSNIVNPFESENKMTEFTVQSGNDNLAKYFEEDDEIQVYGTSANSVTFTFNQPGNYKYNAVENYQKSFQIFQPNNRLDMNLSESNWTDYKSSNWNGDTKWQGGGVLCGSSDVWSYAGNYNAKYVVLKFVGIPDTLTFDYERTVSIATDIDWYFAQSADGKSWITLKESDSQVFGGVTSGSEKFGLLPSTRYIKLQYSGNYGARFKNVKIKQRKEIVPRKDTVDFGLGFNGNDPTARTITVDWYNVNNCEVSIIGADADRFVLAEGDDKILSLLDNYDEAILHVSYKHDANTSTMHKATLHIVEKNPDNSYGKSTDIVLIGKTTPAPQEIVWRDDLTPMPSEGSFTGAAHSTSGLDIKLTSLNPEYVTVGGEDGLTLTPVAAGTAYVRAYQAGNDKWAEVADTLEIEVTNLKVQYITWNDKLSNLKHEEGKSETVTLTASSSVENMPITYELDTAAQKIATLNGNVLTLKGWGSGTITAKQVGNEEYVAVQKVKTIVSRNPSAGCDPLVGEWKDKRTLHTLDEQVIDLSGEPRTIDFWAYCDASALWGIWVAEYYDGYWHDVKGINRTDNPGITSTDTHFGPYNLNIKSEKVKIFTKTGATMTRTFHDVRVTTAKYLELAENQMDFSQVDKGSSKTQSFYVNYSNISGALDVTLANPSKQFEVITTMVGEDCGDVGKEVRVDIKCTGDSVGTEDNEIVLKNIDQELRVPVSATVMLPTQAITWNPDVTERNIKTTDNIVLNATATSPLPVKFVSLDENVATIDSTIVGEQKVYFLRIKKYGDVTILAKQAGNDDWSAATDKPVVFHIERVTPTITTYPTATGVVLPNTLSGSTLQGGVASVEGTFQWQEATQSVTRDVNPYTAAFVPNDTNWYNTISFNVEVKILKTPQTITWNRADSTGVRTIDQVVLDATAGSGLPVKYTLSDLTVATIDSTMVDAQKVYFLHVLKGGIVTITATQAGDETYAEAPAVMKKITFNRVIPVISTMPVPTYMYIHHFLSNSTPENGEATVDGNKINGTFTWQDPTELMDVPGNNERVAVFTPYNQDLYTTQTCTLMVNVRRFAPTIVSTSLDTDPANYGTALKNLNLIGSWFAMDHTDPGHPLITGTINWLFPNNQPAVNVPTAKMVFYPEHSEWYDTVHFDIPIHITQIPIVTPTAEATIVYGQALSDAHFTSTTEDPISGQIVSGTVVLDGSVDLTQCCAEGPHVFPMWFTPSDANYTPEAVAGEAMLTVTPGMVFNGNNGNSWADQENWLDKEKPGTSDPVTVDADVEVTGEVTIGGLTINEGKTLTVKEGATLTIGDKDSYVRSAYGSIHVENGGQLICGTGEVKVKDFILDASLNGLLNANDPNSNQPAKSGQVTGENALTVTGDAYFDLALDASGQCSPGWYDFTVPFPVDALTGVSRFDNTTGVEKTIRNEVNYAIMDFSENRRVESGYGWKKFRGVMQPGQCYTITIDDVDNVYRFKKTATGTFNNQTSEYLAYTDSEVAYRGWNGLGNGTMAHVDLSAEGIEKVQIYNHSTNSYTTADIDEYTYVVGASYFIQAPAANSVLNYSAGTKNSDYLRAPRRATDSKNSEFRLTLTREDDNVAADRLYVCASDEALDRYEIGRDLTKFGTPTDSKVAQVWANAYGMKLCDVDMPLINEKASCTIGLFAPEASTYTLAIERAPEDATLYLTYNGKIIWNLTASSYQFNLAKGTTDGYGLRLTAKQAPQVATGVENADTDSQDAAMRKVIIDNTMYIITPEGRMYDAIGNIVR